MVLSFLSDFSIVMLYIVSFNALIFYKWLIWTRRALYPIIPPPLSGQNYAIRPSHTETEAPCTTETIHMETKTLTTPSKAKAYKPHSNTIIVFMALCPLLKTCWTQWRSKKLENTSIDILVAMMRSSKRWWKGEMRWSRVLKLKNRTKRKWRRSLWCRKPCGCANAQRKCAWHFPMLIAYHRSACNTNCGCSGAIFDGLRLHLFNNQLYIHIGHNL